MLMTEQLSPMRSFRSDLEKLEKIKLFHNIQPHSCICGIHRESEYLNSSKWQKNCVWYSNAQTVQISHTGIWLIYVCIFGPVFKQWLENWIEVSIFLYTLDTFQKIIRYSDHGITTRHSMIRHTFILKISDYFGIQIPTVVTFTL